MSQSPATSSALAVAGDAERAAVLDELVGADHDLQARAEGVARTRLSDVEIDDVATAVAAALLAVDQKDLAANAGRTRHGYVEPTEAAWSLLEATVKPWVEDIARRASLGLLDAARRVGLGIFEALERVGQHIRNDDLLVSWAADFAEETTDLVTRVLANAGIVLTDEDPAS